MTQTIRKTAKYPEMKDYIARHMEMQGMDSQMEFYRRVNLQVTMGHEYCRVIIIGDNLPDVDKAKGIAAALKVDPAEFLCVIENCRLRYRGLDDLLVVVPVV